MIVQSDSGWSPKTEGSPRTGDEWGVLKVSAVSWDVFNPAENKQLPPGANPPEAAIVRLGDFLISRANTSQLIAKSVVVTEAPHNLIMSDKIVRLYLVGSSNPHFLKMVNNDADFARAYYAAHATGTSLSMKNVSRNVIYDLPIPLPPLAEQKRIVAKVDELMAICEQLESQLDSQQKGRRQLLEALLYEALEGVE
jgi:type I restriction enzyme S subunit